MIKYLGSKRKLLPHILQAVQDFAPRAQSIIDLFSGTSRVGHAFKKQGYQVFANDINAYAYWLGKCYVECDREDVWQEAADKLEEFNHLKGYRGYFTNHFCEEARFFHPQNGERIDAIRDALAQAKLRPEVYAVLLVALMEAADRVDSTCGIQMAYLKEWAPRALKPIQLRMPDVLPVSVYGKGKAFCFTALEASQQLQADVAYLDPPYNQHSYLGNYHIWETLVRWDNPDWYGKAHKRVDVQERKSPLNSRKTFLDEFSKIIDNLECSTLIVSFNNEGFINRDDMESMLAKRGSVETRVINYKRYVGAQIGIYNPQGTKVGQVKNLYNQEYLYIVSR